MVAFCMNYTKDKLIKALKLSGIKIEDYTINEIFKENENQRIQVFKIDKINKKIIIQYLH